MAIATKELMGSPTFGQTPDGRMTCTRFLQVAWTDRGAFRHQLLPPSIIVSSNVQQFLGSPCPYELGSDGNQLMFAESFSCEPFFGDKDAIVSPPSASYTTDAPLFYPYAKFTVNYEAPQHHVPGITAYSDGTFLPDPSSSLNSITYPRFICDQDLLYDPVAYLSHRVTSGGQLLSVAAPDFWEWQTTTLPVREGVPIPLFIATAQHDVLWPRVPALNSDGSAIFWDRFNYYKSTCNQSPIRLGGVQYEAEELLFLNYDRDDVLMTNGQRAHDIMVHFEAKKVINPDDRQCEGYDWKGGHNHFWDDTASAWARIWNKDDRTIKPYRTTEFDYLFSIASVNQFPATCP